MERPRHERDVHGGAGHDAVGLGGHAQLVGEQMQHRRIGMGVPTCAALVQRAVGDGRMDRCTRHGNVDQGELDDRALVHRRAQVDVIHRHQRQLDQWHSGLGGRGGSGGYVGACRDRLRQRGQIAMLGAAPTACASRAKVVVASGRRIRAAASRRPDPPRSLRSGHLRWAQDNGQTQRSG